MKEPSKSAKQRSRSSRGKLLSSRALKSHHSVDLTRWHLLLDFSAHGQQGTFSRNWWWSEKRMEMLQYCSGTGKKRFEEKRTSVAATNSVMLATCFQHEIQVQISRYEHISKSRRRADLYISKGLHRSNGLNKASYISRINWTSN